MEEVGSNPARIIPAWRQFATERAAPGRALWGIGEPIWAGRTPDELVECQRHESLLNVAFAHSGNWRLLCPYDTDALPGDVIAEAERSHPWVSRSDGFRAGSAQCLQLEVMAGPFDAPLSPAPAHADALPFDITTIAAVRQVVAVIGRAAGLNEARTDDFVLAAHEVASNSVRHAGGAGTLRMWHEVHAVVCEVTDTGRIHEPLVGRQRPSDDRLGGRGVWMANQLCDLVQIRTFDDGSIVRLRMLRTD
jgi:anti-sigma regulatory factor (Ser/Thr protein kinase)